MKLPTCHGSSSHNEDETVFIIVSLYHRNTHTREDCLDYEMRPRLHCSHFVINGEGIYTKYDEYRFDVITLLNVERKYMTAWLVSFPIKQCHLWCQKSLWYLLLVRPYPWLLWLVPPHSYKRSGLPPSSDKLLLNQTHHWDWTWDHWLGVVPLRNSKDIIENASFSDQHILKYSVCKLCTHWCIMYTMYIVIEVVL